MIRTNFLLLCVAAVAVLASLVYLAVGYFNMPDISMGPHGWIALGLGIAFSVVVGGGLSAILIISRRHGYDEAAHEAYREMDPGQPD